MRVSAIFYFVNILFLVSLIVPCMCTENVMQKKVKSAFNSLNNKLRNYDDKKKKIMLAAAAGVLITIMSAVVGGIFYRTQSSKDRWDNPDLVDDVHNLVLEAIEYGILFTHKNYYGGKDIDKSFPSEKDIKKYLLKNLKSDNLDLTFSQKQDLIRMIPYIELNIRKACYNYENTKIQ
ncbi:early transcribed membrane protein [Plasmodium malariae]|uniref:Early transcribed membrane protein n=1 Tax=Plasmodium malariae TaxID=5858 RepID=A0A1A8WMY8_PLAMA|nr:early transcribed membrane protein [Plasmodium malariae]